VNGYIVEKTRKNKALWIKVGIISRILVLEEEIK